MHRETCLQYGRAVQSVYLFGRKLGSSNVKTEFLESVMLKRIDNVIIVKIITNEDARDL
jgi:hypothetical protein